MRHLLYMTKQFCNEYPHRHDGRIHINSFFPPYPSKAFDRFLEAVLDCRRVPFSTYFAVTDQCPYACPHCSYGKHVRGQLTTEQALETIRQIKSVGTVTIGFTGGEPLMRDDIVELVSAVGEDTASILFSTGYRLTTTLAAELRSAGLDCLTIGMESDESAIHDAVRGVQGSYAGATASIALALDAGLYTAISTIGSREKLVDGTLERLAQLAARYGVHEFRILEPIPTGNFSKACNAVLSEDESRQIAAFHKRWNRIGKGPAIASFSHLESAAMFGCGAGFHHLFVDAAGNVCPCDLTPLAFGNVCEEPLHAIWVRMSEWFDMPRSTCLMKRLCGQQDAFGDAAQYPLSVEKSSELCRQLKNDSPLPLIYKNLLRGRKPTNPPMTRP